MAASACPVMLSELEVWMLAANRQVNPLQPTELINALGHLRQEGDAPMRSW